jgi:hypothetical protein
MWVAWHVLILPDASGLVKLWHATSGKCMGTMKCMHFVQRWAMSHLAKRAQRT